MMTRNYLCLALLAALLLESTGAEASRVERGSLILDNIPEPSAEMADSLAGYLGGRQVIPWGWTPKGQLLISTRFGDVAQLHLVDKAGGARRQITFLREPITAAAVSPDPARGAYVFVKDKDGTDRAQIYYQRADGSPARMLTDGKSANGGILWSTAGREVAFSTTHEGGSSDIDIAEPESGALPRLAVGGDNATWTPLDWSADDRKLLVLRTVSRTESYLYVVDLSNGQKREVDPAPGKAAILGGRFSRDGQGVYWISDRDSEFAKLRYVNLFTNEKSVISGLMAGDVEELALSRDGHYLAYVADENGVSKLNVSDLRTHQDLTPPRLPQQGQIDHLNFDADGKQLAFGYSTDNQPRDAYVVDMAANRLEAWTHSEAGAADAGKFIVARLTQFPTYDRPDGRNRQLPVYVYEPQTPGPHPVLLWLHGGPDGQFRPGFDPFLQYVVKELGFAVVAPNLRGSAGYGKSYLALDDGVLRDDVVKDLGALIVWVGQQSSFDAKHVVAAGSGHGGYLALAALVNYNDRLSGAVFIDGISDLITFLSQAAPAHQAGLRAEYGDERDTEMRAYLRRISPLTNADRISRPMLVVQAKNDTRYPPAQADQLVNRLRSRNVDVWYLQIQDEGQEVLRKQNSDALLTAFAQFLKHCADGH